MKSPSMNQVRILQFCIAVLFALNALLVLNLFHPIVRVQRFDVIEAHKVNIREADGTLKASLSNARGFKVFGRANDDVTFSGLMFYNEEGEEQGGLIWEGRKLADGQRQSAGITFDQYREDQNVYLHHDETKDVKGFSISDGLSINARPDYTLQREQYQIQKEIEKLSPEKREAAYLKQTQDGKGMSRRVFVGVNRGLKDNVAYDDTGLFIRNKWGQKAIRLYVDNDNKPHFEFYDALGKKVIYELKVPIS